MIAVSPATDCGLSCPRSCGGAEGSSRPSGPLLSDGLGFDNRNPPRWETSRARPRLNPAQAGSFNPKTQESEPQRLLSCKINYSTRSACARSSTRSAFITVDYVTSPAGIADENDAVPARC